MSEEPRAHRRVLSALHDLDPDRAEVLAAFARAAMRRIPDSQLRGADALAVATRLHEAFEAIDRRNGEEVVIRVLRPPTGLDGRPGATTIVEVASEDRPFLLSTIVEELERTGTRVVRSLHPIVGVERDDAGHIEAIVPARTARNRESLLQVELDGRLPEDQDAALIAQLTRLTGDVLRATQDHGAMRERVRAVADELRAGTWFHRQDEDPSEVAELLDWLLDQNLLLLGVRNYRFLEVDGALCVEVVAGSGLGLLSDTSVSQYADPKPVSELPSDVRAVLEDPPLLTVTRSRSLSTVQRRVRMEYLGILRRSPDGRPLEEVRLLGLFTRKAYAEPARTTPILRRKLETILEREDVVAGSHDEVTITSLFQALPKDELFQSGTDELHRTLVGLLHAEEHHEVRTLVRADHRTSTVSVVVTVPRERYAPELRQEIESLLIARYGATRTEVEVALGDRRGALARFLLHLDGDIPEVSPTELQQAIRRMARSWSDGLSDQLIGRFGPDEASRLDASVGTRLPRAYRDSVTPSAAIPDVLLLDAVLTGPEELLVSLQASETPGAARLRAAKRGQPLELSSFLPILESLGLVVVEEIPHQLEADGTPAHLHDLGVRTTSIDADADGPRLADAVLAAWRGHLEVDALNRLILDARLDWRDVGILRAYRRLRRQLGTAYTPEYVNGTLVSQPEVVRALVAYIHARFDPQQGASAEDQQRARQRVEEHLDTLSRLDHDRILRAILNLIDATLRINVFRPDAVADGSGEPYTAIKIDPSAVPGLARPLPYREIFVHSPSVEGVHLRGGPVARGGLRWSDRRDDVRTEVLDLLKAQVLKNAVIVPTGAKGGFVVKREPDDPDALRDEVERQYITFVRGLLDVTDDREGDTVVPPPNVVRHDGDDPYLVVAADRGTATFSDTANDLAARYGFWLDDAFASGGSNGYDHKALGVTARGAWLAVERHFRELGIDVATEPITVVGVGDMSGDVFGNGLLRSRAVQLVAAFDHRDIFLDPEPDPSVSFEERRRLFELPGSTWGSYDPTLISPGGGVFPRSVRSIPLSDAIRTALRIEDEELSPPALIRAILRAPVDLLFAGGIGTYVKASVERDDELGDRANQELRIDAKELRARVIGEGANLFITQRGRIEYARRGGHCNQDAIDNAAGVSTSDHEVNVKILLTLAEESGALDRQERDQLLASLTDDVVALVMRDMDLQTAAISREAIRSPERLHDYDQLLDRLERDHELDRDGEVLPSSAELTGRREAGAGLTRPELATLVAWAKRDLREALLDSEVIGSEPLEPALHAYFPAVLNQRFPELIPRHRLRNELVATVVTNDLVNRMGVTFADATAVEAGRSLPEVVVAYRIARTCLQAEQRWEQLELLEQTHDPQRVRELETPLHRVLGAVTSSLLTDPQELDPLQALDRIGKVASELIGGMLQLGTTEQRRGRIGHARWLVDDLVDPDLARFLACASDLAMIPDVARVMDLLGDDRAATDVADAFLRLGDALGIDRLEALLERLPATVGWSRRQKRGLATDLRRSRGDAALLAMRAHGGRSEQEAVVRFVTSRADQIARAARVIDEAERAEEAPLDAIAVAVRQVRDLLDPLV
jgi:glutamate dehydrogenase